jgi:hypothetical protein
MKDITSGTEVDLDSSVYIFSGTALTIQTTNYIKIKSYTLKAIAIVTGYTITNFITFKVDIIDTCDQV